MWVIKTSKSHPCEGETDGHINAMMAKGMLDFKVRFLEKKAKYL